MDGKDCMEYAVVTDGPCKGYVLRSEDRDKWEELVLWPDEWVRTDLMANAGDQDDEPRLAYELVSREAAEEAANRRCESLTKCLRLADEVAERAHAGQLDRGGHPYIGHPRHVSAECRSLEAKVTGLLHDVVEDTDVSLDNLGRLGIPGDILAALDILTHRPGVSYEDYVCKVATNRISREVKVADLHHNMDLSRLGHEPTGEDLRRRTKYERALAILGAS